MSTLTSLAAKADALAASPLMLTRPKLAELTTLSLKTLERMGNKVPGYTRVGRKVLYVRAAALAWINAGCPLQDEIKSAD